MDGQSRQTMPGKDVDKPGRYEAIPERTAVTLDG